MKSHLTPESGLTSPPPSAPRPPTSPPFTYRTYQRDDLARAAMHDGAIIGWDPGLGKTMAIYSLPFLKRSRLTLIVAPPGLHQQITEEGRGKFGVTLTPIPDQETALRLIRQGILPSPGCQINNQQSTIINHQSTIHHPPSPIHAHPQFFITSYQALGYNGADEWEGDPSPSLAAARLQTILSLGHPVEDPAIIESLTAGIGHEKDIGEETSHIIRCVIRPSLASIICGIFDCVICDEAVRLKSGTSCQAQGVLRMAPRYRYALTGTPIKNKLPDFFFLASWVTGRHARPIARWPYGNTVESRGEFSRDFGVIEENITRRQTSRLQGKKPPPPKTTNQICNVHRLWRILGPVIIRRRKDDVPDTVIVPKTIVPVRVMPGARQKLVYQHHLHHPPQKRGKLASIGAQLQNLRQAALNPSSAKLRGSRSDTPWTPKFTAILRLAADILAKREQLVIFSPFQDFSASLSTALRDAAVPHLLLDGNLTPARRGALVNRFKSREIPILIAGIDSMGEGYSLDTARHLILPSLSWAFDSNTQAVERVHRLTSRKDVTIYVMVTTGTIDERLCSIWQEKGDSSDLALDGRLITADRQEIDLGTLLRDAVSDFDPASPTLSEDEVALHWKAHLLPALAAAALAYASHQVAGTTSPSTPYPIQNPPTPSSSTSRPPSRSLFHLMKNKRPATTPPVLPTVAPDKIIPFPINQRPPGLALPVPAARPYAMPRVTIPRILRQSKS